MSIVPPSRDKPFTAPDWERFFVLSPDPLGLLSLRNGCWLRVNAAFSRVFQWSPDDLAGLPHRELVHPDELPGTPEGPGVLRSLVSSTRRVRCKDGTYRQVAWTTTEDPGGDFLYCLGREAEPNPAEQALRETERKYEQLVRHAAVIVDLHYRFGFAAEAVDSDPFLREVRSRHGHGV